jgi:hypothetical protein
MDNAKKSRPTDPKDDRREGYKLAITMLRELEASPELCDLCALDEFVTGRATPQDNIVLRYLEKCRGRSASVEAGFCAILSDLVAESSEGFTLKATDYQKGLKIRVPGRVSKEAERLRTWKSVARITGQDYGPMPPDFGTPGWAKKQRDARKSAAAKESTRG